ncbi:MAG: hypothetical protein DRI57_24695 [Deltaproteobacteria bacterium]|nr:MAG: hypothetical protein DRI57_24695 [Deltaproteobacteria bacterium]
MNADGLSAADSSAFICVHPRFVEAVFPGKNPGKLLPEYLSVSSVSSFPYYTKFINSRIL